MPWPRGKSGNPNGTKRPPHTPDQRKALAEAWRLCPVAMAEVEKMLTAKDTDPRLRLDCAKLILDRGLGKPVQQVDMAVDDQRNPDEMTPAQRLPLMRAALAEQERLAAEEAKGVH